MDYQKFVEEHKINFAEKEMDKVAEDLAQMLNMDLFQIDLSLDDECQVRSAADNREKLFNYFCKVCEIAGVDLPDLEEKIYQAYLPTKNKSEIIAEETISKVFSRLEGLSDHAADVSRAYLETLKLFTNKEKRISLRSILAVLNLSLKNLNCELIRPGYDFFKNEIPKNKFVLLGHSIKVLIVDDQKDELLRTALAMIGWSGVEIDFCYYPENWEGDKESQISNLSWQILAKESDIVLMDQDLGRIEGSDVIKEARELGVEAKFVANTGGSPRELEELGAFKNCQKGRNLQGIFEAIVLRNVDNLIKI